VSHSRKKSDKGDKRRLEKKGARI